MHAGSSNAKPQIGHVSSLAPSNVAVVYVSLLSNSTSTCEAKWCLHTKTYVLDALSAVQIAKSCCKALIAPLYCLPELRSGVKLLSLFISLPILQSCHDEPGPFLEPYSWDFIDRTCVNNCNDSRTT